MLQIKNLTITHKKDLRPLLEDFNFTLNTGDRAVIISEEGNGKSTLLKLIYDEQMAAVSSSVNTARISSPGISRCLEKRNHLQLLCRNACLY